MTIKTLTVDEASLSGVDLVPAAMGATDTAFQFANDGATLLFIKNGGLASIDVTISTPQTIEGLAIADPVVTIAVGEMTCIGPFKPRFFNDGNGLVTATPDVPDTTIAGQAIRLPRI